jgi:hypothetical protein
MRQQVGFKQPKVPQYNVPNQGNHQTAGKMVTPMTPAQTTTPGLKPMGGMTSQPTQIQTNMADKTSQAMTRQVKANTGMSTGPGSGSMTPANNTYGHAAGGLGNYAGNMMKKFGSMAGMKGGIGSGLAPQMLFQSYNTGKPQEVACSGKKGMMITSEEITDPMEKKNRKMVDEETQKDSINRMNSMFRPNDIGSDTPAGIPITQEGSGIHIKKSHEGRFTEYKERTGKTTEEALHSKDPHVRQMANFAKNAKKWHH